MGIILVVILAIVFIGALPTWRHSKSWGPYPSGGIGLILLILIKFKSIEVKMAYLSVE